MPVGVNWLLFLGSFVAFYLFVANGLSYVGWNLLEQWLGKIYFRELAFSRYFITDYLLALIISINFASARVLAAHITIAENRITAFIRNFANLTFALYLLHQPMLQFLDAMLADYQLQPNLHHLLVSGITFAVIVAVGSKIENTKHLYRRFFKSLNARFSKSAFALKSKPVNIEQS